MSAIHLPETNVPEQVNKNSIHLNNVDFRLLHLSDTAGSCHGLDPNYPLL